MWQINFDLICKWCFCVNILKVGCECVTMQNGDVILKFGVCYVCHDCVWTIYKHWKLTTITTSSTNCIIKANKCVLKQKLYFRAPVRFSSCDNKRPGLPWLRSKPCHTSDRRRPIQPDLSRGRWSPCYNTHDNCVWRTSTFQQQFCVHKTPGRQVVHL